MPPGSRFGIVLLGHFARDRQVVDGRSTPARAESEALPGISDMGLAARHLAEYGPREVLVTQSSGVTLLAGGQVYEAAFTSRSLAGRTGRSDACFCSYLGCRLSKAPGEGARWAAAIGTLRQEKPGPWRGAVSDVEALLRKPEYQ